MADVSQLRERRAKLAAAHAAQATTPAVAQTQRRSGRRVGRLLRRLAAPVCLCLVLLSAAFSVPDAHSFSLVTKQRKHAPFVKQHLFFASATTAGGAHYVGAFRNWVRLPSVDASEAPMVLCALNVLVFLLWQTISTGFMYRHFTVSTFENAARKPWTLITASFSHASILHLATNLYSILSVSGPLLTQLGAARFLQLYLLSGVVSNAGSLIIRTLMGRARSVTSNGASGAVYGCLAAQVLLARKGAAFSFYGVTLSPPRFLAAKLATEYAMGGGGVDVAGHASGALCGAALAAHWRRRWPKWLRKLGLAAQWLTL
jgi:membrane associated rhomboid family serine protease